MNKEQIIKSLQFINTNFKDYFFSSNRNIDYNEFFS